MADISGLAMDVLYWYTLLSLSPCLKLTIEVADSGTPQLTRTGCLQISVEDINDFPPTFNQVRVEINCLILGQGHAIW